MPTSHPRIQVTVTDELRRALGVARATWPALPESQLLTALACRGVATLPTSGGSRGEARRAALARAQDELGDCYPTGYLDELRADWPA